MGWADIDAALADEAEEERGFNWRGRGWKVHSSPPASMLERFADAADSDGSITITFLVTRGLAMVCSLLTSDEDREAFRAAEPTLRDVSAVLAALKEIYGLAAGESEPSPASSRNGGKPSKRTSQRSTA